MSKELTARWQNSNQIYLQACDRVRAKKSVDNLAERQSRTEAEVERYRNLIAEPCCLIHPESKNMQQWDICTMSALFYTATVTPFEVAFLGDETPAAWNEAATYGLFYTNSIVNLIFFIDMCMAFFTAYRSDRKEGGHWVKNLSKIRGHYMRTWFWIDIVSIIPFDEIQMSMGGGGGDMSKLKIIKCIRLLRLLKLVRVLKASRVYKRWEARISLPYAYIGLIQFTILLMVAGHWFACAFSIMAVLQDVETFTWQDSLARGFYCNGGDYDDLSDQEFSKMRKLSNSGTLDDTLPYSDLSCYISPPQFYAASIYWSIVTITSVGYGDITPVNGSEMWCSAFFVLFGAILWAYIIGNACGIISTLDVESIQHRQNMDALNFFMKDQLLPNEQQLRLREYFNQMKDINKNEGYKTLVSLMSPTLKGEVSEHRHAWLKTIPYLADCGIKFIVAITHEIDAAVFVPKEQVEWSDTLFSVGRGVASRAGKICLRGSFWGEDFILDTNALKDKTPTNALTYIEVLMLERDVLDTMLDEFPIQRKTIRHHKIRMAVSRGIIHHAKILKKLREEELGNQDPEPSPFKGAGVEDNSSGFNMRGSHGMDHFNRHASGTGAMLDVKHDMNLLLQRIEMLDLKFDTLLDRMAQEDRPRRSPSRRKLKPVPSS